MNTKKKIFIISGIILLLTLLTVLCVVTYRHKFNKLIIDPYYCETLLEVSPDDFCKSKGEGTFIENAYTFARVDKNGYLILIMSDSQLNKWKSLRYDTIALQAVLGDSKDIGVRIPDNYDGDIWLENITKYADGCGFDISNDYKTIVASPGDDKSYMPFIIMACNFMQLCEGTPSDQIKVEYTEIDKDGNVVEQIIFPGEYPKN